MAAIRKDATLCAPEAVELARSVAADMAEPGTVGDHLGAQMESDRLATHTFVCMARAYRGWVWSVTLARAPRSRKLTVCEASLIPGQDAILSPDWVPYAERLRPGDLRVSDVLPFREDDPLLEPGFEATGDEETDAIALWELGLGRPRVLSAEGREAAAQRWYDGGHGPHAEVAVAAKATCSSCGYFLPLSGALRAVFGVCASPWSPSDGGVVSLDHGCGAHSETDVARVSPASASAPVLDDLAVDLV